MPHFAITIGPIYRTFQQVRKTRELWTASWLFSHISKRLIEEIRRIDSNAVYVPYYESDTPVGIGLFPDRIFLKSENLTIDKIEEIKHTVYSEIAKVVDAVDDNTNSIDFLQSYFRIYTVKYSVSENDNPIVIGNQLLDSAELRDTWQLEEPPNPLLRFFRQVNKVKVDGKKWIESNLSEKDIHENIRFESVMEIATRPIRERDKVTYKKLVRDYCYTDKDDDVDDKEDNFITALKTALNKDSKSEVFKNYHKYVCVLKADGDRVGKYIKAITENVETELADVSKKLYEWGIVTHELIKQYKGVTIYVGGDDVLALLPVVGETGDNVIQLCEKINKSFQARFTKVLNDKSGPIKPTLSFGVSITYYKYPLNEALQKADALLYKAKQTRNTLALSLIKHSGASFDMQLPNGEADVYKTGEVFNRLLPYFAKEENYVSSLIHHLREHEPVYRLLSGKQPDRVANYLNFNFDDDKHIKLVEQTAEMVSAQQRKHLVKAEDAKSSIAAMEETYSMLRMIKFLNGHDDGK